jgi:uncharacterized NAD(P)/FAD-binding protein YdhS
MYDMVFVGGGLSSSLSLIHLIRHLRSRATMGERLNLAQLRLVLIDRFGDFGRGIPYGHLAHPMFLLNNDVSAMNICGFHEWIIAQRERWLGTLRGNQDNTVQDWLRRNQAALMAALADPKLYLRLFLPRWVFGLFMDDLLHEALDHARELGVKIDLIAGEAISLNRESDGVLRVGLRQGGTLAGRQLLLGVGSLPPDPAPHLEGVPGYLHEPCLPDGNRSFKSLLGKVLTGTDSPRRAVLIGSNATAMEALYMIAHQLDLVAALDEILVVSPSGSLPDAACSDLQRIFEPRSLRRLAQEPDISAEQLIRALVHDAEEAKHSGFSSIDYSGPTCDTFGRVFGRLATAERRRFVEDFGMVFTALNRHTPPEYAAAVESLRGSGKLRTLTARVTSIEPTGATRSSLALAMVTADGVTHEMRADAVINCRGSGTLARTPSPLLRHMLSPETGLAVMNRCGRGLAVSSEFEASPGVFVVGPLLAGHSHGSDHLWNLERAERIDSLAVRVGPVVARRLCDRPRWQHGTSAVTLPGRTGVS